MTKYSQPELSLPKKLAEPQVHKNSYEIMKKRHLLKDEEGNLLEEPRDMFWRVAVAIASEDKKYTKVNKTKWKKLFEETALQFYHLMAENRFLPGSRVLYEAGNMIDGTRQLSSCFVLPVEDDLGKIFETMKEAAVVQKNNGGTGFNFSHIRPKGDYVGGTPNVAAGPIHFIRSFSQSFDQVLQGKKRGGGNMAILNVDHPDIIEFIKLKGKESTIRNFNISVGVTDKFMEAVRNDDDYDLINPRNGKVVKSISAREVFDLICEKAWECADPGLFFLDTAENANPTKPLGVIEATNPCGEEPLRSYESCNLGSIVLPTHLKTSKKGLEIDWKLLKQTTHEATHFLDNMIDLSNFPLDKIAEQVKLTRKLGLGVVGLGTLLYKLELPYDSEEGVELTREIIKFIQIESENKSIELAKERGLLPAYKGSKWEEAGKKVRNATMTSIAPTGTLSLVANTSSGIEPIFSLVYKRTSFYQDEGREKRQELLYVDETFEHYAKEKGFYSNNLIEKIAENKGSLHGIKEVPKEAKRIFVTTHDIAPEWHVRMQAAAQENVDAAVSKTINMPHNATQTDVRKAYISAWEMGCKGITIYRDGSKQYQVLDTTTKKTEPPKQQNKIVIASRGSKKISEIMDFLSTINEIEGVEISLEQGDFVNEPVANNKEGMRKAARYKAHKVAEKTGLPAIADETAFIIADDITISKKITNLIYYGQENNYSNELFSEILKHKNSKNAMQAQLACMVVLYNPATGKYRSGFASLPGKLVTGNGTGYNSYFIHTDLDKFKNAPDKNEFAKYHHRRLALAQLFSKVDTDEEVVQQHVITANAHQVLTKRALKTNDFGEAEESPSELWRRIAKFIASAEKKDKRKQVEEDFFSVMQNGEFYSGGTILWAGMGPKTIMSKCLVLPISDTIDSIFHTLNNNIQCLRRGVGTGFNFSKLRSSYATVKTTGENAAGPIEYLRMFDRAQDTIRGRGGRGLGSMAILNVDHPNIEDFIECKDDLNAISHYNISVGISDKFMKAVEKDTDWELIDPHDKKVYKVVKARDLFERIAKHAWKSGDPGMYFLDTAEKGNNTPKLGKMDATNPCGEQPLIPYETCNLGHINVAKFVKGFPFAENPDITSLSVEQKLEYIDWKRLKQVVEIGVRFLDNIIQVNNYPIKEIEEMTRKTRNVGLGLMGYADLLIKLGITYGNEESLQIAAKVMSFIQSTAHAYSEHLGKEKGSFPAFKESNWYTDLKKKHMRNVRTTTIAPTGTISIIADCNPGIEPVFALGYRRKNSMGGAEQEVIDKQFEYTARTRGFYSEDLMHDISEGKHLRDIQEKYSLPQDVVDVFVTTHEIDPVAHVRIQAVFQEYVDSAVSKTINLPNKATWRDIAKVYQLAYDKGCKGITIFRDGSKDPALQVGTAKKKETGEAETGDERQEGPRNLYEPRKREGEVTRGYTYEVATEQGDLFLTINEDAKGLYEVFVNIGKSGSFTKGYAEALGRMISMSIRSGIKPESIIHQLQGIRTSTPTMNKGMIVYSVPDAIAKILRKHMDFRKDQREMFPPLETKEQENSEEKIDEQKEDLESYTSYDQGEVSTATVEEESTQSESKDSYSSENRFGDMLECPECGSDLEYAEGCILCRSCGYSKCG